MTLQSIQLILFALFAGCAVSSWFLISRVATLLKAVDGPADLIQSLHALAFSGDGGPSIWPGHRFLLRRQYLDYRSPQLSAAGNYALALLCLVYVDAAAMVGTMLVS
jgi:hypothetical protein